MAQEYGSINKRSTFEDEIVDKIFEFAQENEIGLIFEILKENKEIDLIKLIDKKNFTCIVFFNYYLINF